MKKTLTMAPRNRRPTTRDSSIENPIKIINDYDSTPTANSLKRDLSKKIKCIPHCSKELLDQDIQPDESLSHLSFDRIQILNSSREKEQTSLSCGKRIGINDCLLSVNVKVEADRSTRNGDSSEMTSSNMSHHIAQGVSDFMSETSKDNHVRYDFVAEYGDMIDQNLLKMEARGGWPVAKSIGFPMDTHLSRHGVTEVGRARMVDWMYEVLTAYDMGKQTFFLAV